MNSEIKIKIPELIKKDLIFPISSSLQDNWSLFFWADFQTSLLNDDQSLKDEVIGKISIYKKIVLNYSSRLSTYKTSSATSSSNNTSLNTSLEKQDLSTDNNHFFRAITINNIPFTIVFFKKNKEIYLLSHKIRFELLLQEQIETFTKDIATLNCNIECKNNLSIIIEKINNNFQSFKKIIEAISKIDINNLNLNLYL